MVKIPLKIRKAQSRFEAVGYLTIIISYSMQKSLFYPGWHNSGEGRFLEGLCNILEKGGILPVVLHRSQPPRSSDQGRKKRVGTAHNWQSA